MAETLNDVESPTGLTREQLERMFVQMHQIRTCEEKVAFFFSRGMVHGTTHLYVGEEATAVGAIAALADDDLITSTHRGHGHTIAKGIDLNELMAELLGKRTGACKGKGGSMHIADLSKGNLGANGVVGGGLPIAVGAGLSIRMLRQARIVVCFFGDGASNEGTFHESLNLAAVWRLPVVFVCENNQYGMSMSVKRSTAIENLADRARAYGMPGRRVDGNDVFKVYDAVREARAHAKDMGPVLVVAETYRYMGHSKSDANKYRTKEEIACWRELDPIPRLRKRMQECGLFTEAQLARLEEQAKDDIEQAVEFALSSPDPEVDDLFTDVYAEEESR